ncbi:GMC family oxidoreductase [Pseudonocardia sp. GCM10023141]|uniref:GMC family oxidoreductase n=1 Tax=Pseudonocardia sp. GCM10023141 TaxID=3252653 RepID=UPI0036115A55
MTDAAAVGALLGLTDPAAAGAVAARLDVLLAAMPVAVRAGVRAGLGAVAVAARTGTGRPLSELDVAGRDALLTRITAHPALAAALDLVKMPALLAAGAVAAPSPAPGGRPDAELDCTPSFGWPGSTRADAVVIGSGAGGAMAARTLARAGLAVIVLEEGRRHPVAEFRTASPLDRFRTLYRDGGATVALGNPPVVLPIGRGVGGTTLVNSGTCYRTPDHVLARWSREHGLAVDRFPALLDEVEATLQVAPQPLDVLGANGEIALRGARALGWAAAPLRRNAPGCGGCCQCAIGCPRNAKNGVHLNALPQACAAGARIVTDARVERVLSERGRAAGVLARRPDGTAFAIRAPLVVVAAGATETPPLLRRSGLGRHPGLGRGMAVHPAVSVAGRFAEPVRAWQGVMQSVGVEELHRRGILIEATAAPPGMSTFVLPGLGSRLAAERAGADRLAFLGAMIADRPSGRVHGSRRPLLTYRLHPDDAATLRDAIVAMGRILFAAGAQEVLTGLTANPVATTVNGLRDIVAGTPTAALHVAAFHPTGSARMGADAQRAPVDATGALRGISGVVVADASVLPSCPEVNPQLSIMAAALAVAHHAAGT